MAFCNPPLEKIIYTSPESYKKYKDYINKKSIYKFKRSDYRDEHLVFSLSPVIISDGEKNNEFENFVKNNCN